jgi:ubiquinone/menaquinone biosynthesis C-methylase UbiE
MPSPRVATLMQRLYGKRINGTIEFRNLIAERVRPEYYVLDLGCGAGRQETDFRRECALVAGCDYSAAVGRNRFISAGVRGDAYRLPFKSQMFDVVIMDFVMEHLQFPDTCAAEISRVLKAGGALFFRTPNAYHYVALVARLTPHSFHRFVVCKLAGSHEADTFETFYRMNTRREVMNVFTRASLELKEIRMVEKEPYYLSFALPTFLLGAAYERLVNRFEGLAGLRSNIFGYFTKPFHDDGDGRPGNL